MKIVIFGLSISSSWGNGHATLWRGLCGALIRRGHQIHFFEQDVPYYSNNRDLTAIPGGHLHFYSRWDDIAVHAKAQLADADVAVVTSYCPDALAATRAVLDARAGVSCFYDLDTPVTLDRLQSGQTVDYIGPRGLRDFDLVLSYTGGKALTALQQRLGARRVEPLYGSVDPNNHYPVAPQERYRSDLSYLGTYAHDRQMSLEQLFVEPARTLPGSRFMIAGAMYPGEFPWTQNIFFVRHLPPTEHPAFYCSSKLTLNVTRQAMADMGYCPSGRLFEAAACGVPILSDTWEGLDQFFQPGSEILIAQTAQEALAHIQKPDSELAGIAKRARERTLDCHTAAIRALDFESAVAKAMHSAPVEV